MVYVFEFTFCYQYTAECETNPFQQLSRPSLLANTRCEIVSLFVLFSLFMVML